MSEVYETVDDRLEQQDYGFQWGNVKVVRAMRRTHRRTVHRCLFVKSQHHRLEVYVTEARGQFRVYLDGRELS